MIDKIIPFSRPTACRIKRRHVQDNRRTSGSYGSLKNEIKSTLEQAMKAQRVSGGIVLLFL
jgi:hypothetical protein